MGKYQNVADKSFNTGLDEQLTPDKKLNLLGVYRGAPGTKPVKLDYFYPQYGPVDLSALVMLFFRYGQYLELIGGDTTVEETQVFTFTAKKWEAPPVEEAVI